MNRARGFASVVLGLVIAGLAFKLTACGPIDPNPPDPGVTLTPDLVHEMLVHDASTDAEGGP